MSVVDSLGSPSHGSMALASWLQRYCPCLLVMGCFLPYLGQTFLNGRHVITYGLLLLVLSLQALGCPVLKFPRHSLLTPILRLWVAWVGIICVSTLWFAVVQGRNTSSTVSLLAGLEQHLQPAVVTGLVMGCFAYLTPPERETSLRRAMNVMISGLCINALLIILMFWTGKHDIFNPWLPPNFQEDTGVWQLSLQMGRTGGIFNQPFELGVSHSVGLFAWGFLQSRRGRMPMWEISRLLLLMVGGIAAMTKVFLLGGLPLFLIALVSYAPFRKTILSWRLLLTAILGLQLFLALAQSWIGVETFLNIFQVDRQSIFIVWTAGRYSNQGASGLDYYGEIWKHSPLIGFGFSPFEVLDSGPLAVFATSGLLGSLIFCIFLLFSGAKLWYLSRQKRDYAILLYCLFAMVGACMGALSFVVNKGSTFFWVMFAGLALALERRWGTLEPRR